MVILLTLTLAGIDTGPFDLYSNADNYTIPFSSNIEKSSLVTGYTVTVDDSATIIRIVSKGACVNYNDISLQNTTTTTTTIPGVPCNEAVTAGGEGITDLVINLDSIGGLVVVAVNAYGVPDKLEILHNGVKKATSSMTTPNEGPFDNVYGNPIVPTIAQTESINQFIGTSKGTIPSRQATFASETGSTLVLPAGSQQLVWWSYTSGDYALNAVVTVRITGPNGTSWSIQRVCETTTTTTSSSSSTTTTTTVAPIPIDCFEHAIDATQTAGSITYKECVSPYSTKVLSLNQGDFIYLCIGEVLSFSSGIVVTKNATCIPR